MKRALFFFLIVAALPLSADVKIKSKMSVSGRSMERTEMVKGQRSRSEMEIMPGMSQVQIYQCDKKQMIQLNDRCKVYMVTSLEDDAETTAATAEKSTGTTRAARPTRTPTTKGGVVTMTSTMKDTGQRKKFFGYDARNIKSTMTSESSPDACQQNQMEMETDGWYIDFPGVQVGCVNPERAMMASRPPAAGGCRDEMKFKRSGSARLGYPVQVETTMKGPNGQPFTIKQEVTELQNASLDASLFEIPAGYREVKDQQALMCMGDVAAMMRGSRPTQTTASGEDGSGEGGEGEGSVQTQRAARPKRAGKVRVGVVQFDVPTSESALAAADPLRMSLIRQLEEVGAEAVALDVKSSDSRETIEKAAKEQSCDYILYNELAMTAPQAKGNAGKKLGGFLSKAAGVASGNVPAPTYDASMKFRLFQTGDANVHLESVATGTSGASSAESAAEPALENEAEQVMVQIKKDAELRRRGLR